MELTKTQFQNVQTQAEAEVVPSSNLVEVKAEVWVEVWGGWLEKVRIKLNSTQDVVEVFNYTIQYNTAQQKQTTYISTSES